MYFVIITSDAFFLTRFLGSVLEGQKVFSILSISWLELWNQAFKGEM